MGSARKLGKCKKTQENSKEIQDQENKKFKKPRNPRNSRNHEVVKPVETFEGLGVTKKIYFGVKGQ
jgi:hypothetical protein